MEQDKYNSFLQNRLRETLFEPGIELNQLLIKEFGVSPAYGRKIISRAVDADVIASSAPVTFGNGQHVYLSKKEKLDLPRVMDICSKYRPPIYRLLDLLLMSDNIVSYYEGMKITSSPVGASSTKITNLDDILKILKQLDLVYEKNDLRGAKYIILKTGLIIHEEVELKMMSNHYSKMTIDCSLIPDVLRWLARSNLIGKYQPIYRNKKTPYIGPSHNNLVWDAFTYTSATGINSYPGSKKTVPDKMTLVVFDVILSMPYSQSHLDGYYNRVQVNINSVKSGERKILPIIIYKECSPDVLSSIAGLGFLAFDIGSVFGTKIYSVLQKLDTVNRLLDSEADIDKTVKSILSTIRASGQEDSLKDLKGVLFELLLYPLVSELYSKSIIRRGVTLKINDGLKLYREYDYIIQSSHPPEIVLIEVKGYPSTATIPLGDKKEKASLKWFFEGSVSFARTYFKKELSTGIKLKASFITSANFWEDGKHYVSVLNKSSLKPYSMEAGYDRDALLNVLTERKFTNEYKIIQKYYKGGDEEDGEP